ncbi:MAG: site-specific integrase [Atopobiaceae bacterium]|nr:site-specific integrase [Atopobiaceae bacterium]
MTLSASTTNEHWGFVDQAMGDAKVFSIASLDFSGDGMIAELESNPIVSFGSFSIDFNSDTWFFDIGENPVVTKCKLTASFDGLVGKQVWKLFLLCQIVWKTSKTHTCIQTLKYATSTFSSCGGADPRCSRISGDDFRRYVDSLSEYSCSYRHWRATALSMFLDFRSTFFGITISHELRLEIGRVLKEDGRALWRSDGVPAIDDEYLLPLIETCESTLADDNASHRMGVAAAALLIATQIGMRISELRALEVGSLHVSRLDGKRDVGYIEFRTFKGAKGDGTYKPARAVMSHRSLVAYLWLEDHCKEDRERLKTSSLIVLPKQKNKVCTDSTMRELVLGYILANHKTVPCIGTQGRFPELSSVVLGNSPLGKRLMPVVKACELSGDETFVYPKPHSFRATVATKLYEDGVDERFIQLHMSHLNMDTTVGYIRSDREIEKANNDLVYRTVLGDGAEMIGPRGNAFQQKVEQFVASLPDKVKANLDEVVKAASKTFPLRRKVGGVCIHCGGVVSCKSDNETDQIYCAFGVCPNQCVLYFMADQCLDTVRSHMELIPINLERGHTKAARNELRKAQNVIRDALVPELDSLDRQIATLGRDGVLRRFPDLEELIDTLPEVRKEVAEWQAMII